MYRSPDLTIEQPRILKRVWFCTISGFEEQTSFGPHVIKVMDDDMLTRVCQKYEKMGHSVQLKTNIIKLNQIKSDTCLQEEVIYMYIHSLLPE